MFYNRKNSFLFIGILLLNFYTHAHFSEKPENAHEFELLMAEHSIGVGITMRFMLNQPEVLNQSTSPFRLLLKHRELIHRRAQQHDLSKFAHTPEFVKRYYPADRDQPMSTSLVQFYGKNIRNYQNEKEAKNELTQDDIKSIHDAKVAVKAINEIDDMLLDELIEDYTKDKNLSHEEIIRLRQELHNFEHAADLLNRKMFEDVYRFRRNRPAKGTSSEILEFGHRIVLNSDNIYHWQSQLRSREIALKYYHSPLLRYLILNISPRQVVELSNRRTKSSPFLNEDSLRERNASIATYIKNRLQISPIERNKFTRQYRSANIPSCTVFYSF